MRAFSVNNPREKGILEPPTTKMLPWCRLKHVKWPAHLLHWERLAYGISRPRAI